MEKYKVLITMEIMAVFFMVGIVLTSCSTKGKKTVDRQNSIVEHGSMVKDSMQFDQTVIFQSALEGNIQVVQTALDCGFAPNTVDENKRTALMLAAYNGNTQIVKLLVEMGAEVNFTDENQRTALMYASSGPFVETVLVLLQAGANPNMIEKQENWTAAMMAAAEGQLEVLETLVSYGADLNMVDIDGESSLDFATAKGHSAVAGYIKSQLKQ